MNALYKVLLVAHALNADEVRALLASTGVEASRSRVHGWGLSPTKSDGSPNKNYVGITSQELIAVARAIEADAKRRLALTSGTVAALEIGATEAEMLAYVNGLIRILRGAPDSPAIQASAPRDESDGQAAFIQRGKLR